MNTIFDHAKLPGALFQTWAVIDFTSMQSAHMGMIHAEQERMSRQIAAEIMSKPAFFSFENFGPMQAYTRIKAKAVVMTMEELEAFAIEKFNLGRKSILGRF